MNTTPKTIHSNNPKTMTIKMFADSQGVTKHAIFQRINKLEKAHHFQSGTQGQKGANVDEPDDRYMTFWGKNRKGHKCIMLNSRGINALRVGYHPYHSEHAPTPHELRQRNGYYKNIIIGLRQKVSLINSTVATSASASYQSKIDDYKLSANNQIKSIENERNNFKTKYLDTSKASAETFQRQKSEEQKWQAVAKANATKSKPSTGGFWSKLFGKK